MCECDVPSGVCMHNIHIHVPFVCACELMCLACLREITQSARAALAVRVEAENGAFVAALASHYRVGVTPRTPLDRPSVCHFLSKPSKRRHWQAIVPGRAR